MAHKHVKKNIPHHPSSGNCTWKPKGSASSYPRGWRSFDGLTPNAGRLVGQLAVSHIVRESVKWYVCFGERAGPRFSIRHTPTCDLAILPLDIYWEVKTFDHKENCLEPNTGRSSGTHQRNGYTKLGRVVRWDTFDSTKTRTNTAVGSAKNIMLTESRHIQKSTYRLIPSLWNSRTDKINLWRKKKSEVVAWGVGRCAVGTDWGGAWENFLGWR